MGILIVVLIAWILYPFFGIPFAVSVKSDNTKLKKRIEELEFENRKLKYSRPEDTVYNRPSELINTPDIPSGDVKENFSDEKSTVIDNIYETSSPAPESAAEENIDSEESVFNDCSDSGAEGQMGKKGSEKSRNVSGLLISGVSMVLLAGLVFVTTNWSIMSNGFKVFLMILATAMFFGASAFAERKLSIHSTSKGFYILGTLFIPITCVAFFFFEMLGSWISFSGEGRWLALMTVFLSCSASCILITRKYQLQLFAFSSMMFISAAVGSLALFTDVFAGVMIVSAGFSVLLLVLNEDILTKLHVPFIFTEVYKLYSRISAFAFAFVLLMYSAADGSYLESAAAVLFIIALTLYIQFKTPDFTGEMICRIASAVEYLILSGLVVASALDAGVIDETPAIQLMFTLLCVPAFAAYIFVPFLKSEVPANILSAVLFILSMVCFDSGHPAACAVVLVMLIANAVNGRDYTNFTASLLSVPLMWQFLTLCEFKGSTVDKAVSYAVILLYATAVFGTRKFSRLKVTSVVFMAYTAFIPFIFSAAYSDLVISGLTVTVFAAAAYEYARTDKKILNVLASIAAVTYIQIFAAILFTAYIFEKHISFRNYIPAYVTGFAVMALLAAAGFALKRINETDGKITVFLSGLMPLVMMTLYVPDSDGIWPFIYQMAYIAYCTACGYVSGGTVRKLFLTSGTVLLAYALAAQKFFEVNRLILPEYLIFCSFVPYIFLFRIWKNERKAVDIVMFVHTITAILILSCAAVSENELVHALVIGVVCVAVLIITAFTKDRKWRVMANTTLVFLALYMTRDFWASLAWWVYLLTAGVILIAYAAFNEYCRKTGTENMIKNEIDNMIHSVKNRTEK